MRATIKFDLEATGHPSMIALIEDLVDTFQADDLPLDYITVDSDEAAQLCNELDEEGIMSKTDALVHFSNDTADFKGVPLIYAPEEDESEDEPEEDIIEMEVTIADI